MVFFLSGDESVSVSSSSPLLVVVVVVVATEVDDDDSAVTVGFRLMNASSFVCFSVDGGVDEIRRFLADRIDGDDLSGVIAAVVVVVAG